MPRTDIRRVEQQPRNNRLENFFSFFGGGDLKTRLLASLTGAAYVKLQFAKTGRNSILNHITSYFAGCEAGTALAEHQEELAAHTGTSFLSIKPSPAVSPYYSGISSALIYLLLLSTVFRNGELYGRTGNTLYLKSALLMLAILLPMNLFNKLLDENHQAVSGYNNGFYDCYHKHTPQFHKSAPYPNYVAGTYLGLIFIMAVASIAAFAFGAASGSAPRHRPAEIVNHNPPQQHGVENRR